MPTRKINVSNKDDSRTEMYQQLDAAGVSEAVRLQGQVIVQLAGTATDVVARVEHATRDPGTSEANWAPAENSTFTGNLSAGLPPRRFTEPADGFWRVNVTTLTGGHCKVSIIGESA